MPRRLRRLFRGAFVLLLAATIALALDVLHDEKQRSHRAYAVGLRKSEAQVAARLRHPTGQLMLLNAAAADLPATPLVPLVLPFGAIDFDDRSKALQAVELAGCGVVYGDGSNLCAGIGSNPFAGAFVYVVGQIPAAALVPHRAGQLDFSLAHRAWVEIRLAGGEHWRWIAPYQAQAGDVGAAPSSAAGAQRGRLVAFDADAEVSGDTRPQRDVRGWMWQEGECLDRPGAATAQAAAAAAGAPASLPAAAAPMEAAPSASTAASAGASRPAVMAPAAMSTPAAVSVPTPAASAAASVATSSATSAATNAATSAATTGTPGGSASAASGPAVGAPAVAAAAASGPASGAAPGGPTAVPAATATPAAPPAEAGGCLRRTYLSLRLPVPAWREALDARGAAAWPPAQLASTQVRLQFLGPGEGHVLFDSDNPGRSGTAAASAPFALAEFRRLLLPGETLRVQREGSDGVLLEARGADPEATEGDERPLPWIDELIRRLPVPGYEVPIEQRSTIATRLGNYRLTLLGDLRSVNRQLAAVATRLAGYVGAMLAAVLGVWLLLEVVVIRRIALLTRRAAAASESMRTAAIAAADGRPQRLDAALELGDLAGRDELGVLAQGLRDLLTRVNADVERERIRVRQERDQWHAVGHEIVSPLQSLIALHGGESDPASRYLRRMQQAVRVLYGQASPSEAFESTQLTLAPVDLDVFAAMVAGNAHHIDIADVRYREAAGPAWVMADEHSLEDVLTHVLRNAERHREPGTPITLTLVGQGDAAGGTWQLVVHNQGPTIAGTMLERIFEYGVSGDAVPGGAQGPTDDPPFETRVAPRAEPPAGSRIEPPFEPRLDPQGGPADDRGGERRGQGLFVARTYMAKMGGTIRARNVADGVEFVLSLPRAERP